MAWEKGPGALGPLAPLMGDWRTEPPPPDANEASATSCTRSFQPFGPDWVRLEAQWSEGADAYREIALYGMDGEEALAFHSFTSDGKRSNARLSDATDVHPEAIAFASDFPGGAARVIYWPREDAAAGFHFAVEIRTDADWTRHITQTFGPA
ncbi:hypothetical protein [Brevundimonas sp.]